MAHWGLIGRISASAVDEQPHFFQPHKVHVVTLKAVDIEVTIRGFTARVDASLTYHNATDKALEVEYRMPVDEGAAVYKFEAVIDGRKITAQCLEKKKAEQIYKDAVKSGHTAVLAREDDLSADIFHLALGNLPGGSKAELKLSMLMELKVKTDGAVSFTLPTILNPRYCPSDVTASQHTASVAQSGRHETVTSEVYAFGLKAKVQGGHAVASIVSHHDFLIVKPSDDNMSAEVTQDSGSFKPDHDWNMLIYYANPYKTHLIREKGDRSSTGLMKDDLLMVNLHPELPEQSYSHRNEVIFVVDRSGSMQGDKIQSARATLLLFLKSLPTGCYFNVISFGSTYSLLFPSGSEEYTEQTLQKALELHDRIYADMGGTEILQPMKQIYSTPPKSGFARQIILLTDGEVFNVDQVKELVRRHAHETRVFAVGIGDGASTALVHGVARAGHGFSEMVYQQDKLQFKVMGLVRAMLQESVQDVNVTFDVEPPGGIKLIPKNLPIIFGGKHLIIYVRVPTSTQVKDITISGVVGNKNFKNCLNGSDIVSIHDEEKTLHRLAARAQINEWQINEEEDVAEEMMALSLATGVVCRRTALVGVDQDEKLVALKPESQTQSPYQQQGQVKFQKLGLSSSCSSRGMFSSMPRQQGQSLFQPQALSQSSSSGGMFGSMAPAPHPGMSGVMSCPMPQSMCWRALREDQNMPVLMLPNKPPSIPNCGFGGTSFGSKVNESASSTTFGFGNTSFGSMVQENPASIPAFGFGATSFGSQANMEEKSVGKEHSPVNYETNLMAIVSLQKFDGSWTLEDAVKITSLAHSLLASATVCKDEKAWATSVVLAFLEIKYSAKKEEWILLANKSKMFITRCGDDVQTLMESGRKILLENQK